MAYTYFLEVYELDPLVEDPYSVLVTRDEVANLSEAQSLLAAMKLEPYHSTLFDSHYRAIFHQCTHFPGGPQGPCIASIIEEA